MYQNSYRVCLLLVVFNFLNSCHSKYSKIFSISGNEFSTVSGHLFSPSRIKINKDSTFEFFEGGPATKISKGIWTSNIDSPFITLTSIDTLPTLHNKTLVDTLFLNLTGTKVFIKSRSKIAINGIVYKKS